MIGVIRVEGVVRVVGVVRVIGFIMAVGVVRAVNVAGFIGVVGVVGVGNVVRVVGFIRVVGVVRVIVGVVQKESKANVIRMNGIFSLYLYESVCYCGTNVCFRDDYLVLVIWTFCIVPVILIFQPSLSC